MTDRFTVLFAGLCIAAISGLLAFFILSTEFKLRNWAALIILHSTPLYVLTCCIMDYYFIKMRYMIDDARSSNQSLSLLMLYDELSKMTFDQRLSCSPDENGSFFKKVCLELVSDSYQITSDSALRERARYAAREINEYWNANFSPKKYWPFEKIPNENSSSGS